MRIFGVSWAFLGAVFLLWMVKTLGHPPDTREMLWMPFACFLGLAVRQPDVPELVEEESMSRKEFGWFWCILGLGLYIGFAVAVMTKPLNIPTMGMLAILVVGWTYYTAVIIHKNSEGNR